MKKIVALALSLMMLLVCVSALADNTIAIENAFTVKFGDLPEGYNITVIDEPTKDYTAIITKEDETSVGYILSIAFNDEWDGVNTWADATEDDIAAVEADFYEVTELDLGDIIFSNYKTQSGIDLYTALENGGAFAALYTIYNSHEIELDIFPADGHTLTLEDLDKAIQFVETAEIVPAA